MLLSASCGGQDVILGAGRSDETDTGVPGVAAPSFSTLRPLTDLSGDDTVDDDPSLSADLTEIYFNSQRNGGAGEEDIWTAHRTAAGESWTEVAAVEILNTESRETGIALASDALTLWFSSDRSGTLGGLDVFVTTRPSRSEPWAPPERVDELSGEDDDLVSAVNRTELRIFLARRSSEDADYDLFVADRGSPGGAWGAPLELDALNTAAGESDGVLAADDTTFLFTRDEDLYIARWDASSDTFSGEGPLDDLNSDEDDRDPWISPGLETVVFSSNRTGSYMLYEAVR